MLCITRRESPPAIRSGQTLATRTAGRIERASWSSVVSHKRLELLFCTFQLEITQNSRTSEVEYLQPIARHYTRGHKETCAGKRQKAETCSCVSLARLSL